MNMEVNYCIYTDGSCRASKIGGIGIVWLKNGKKVLEFSKRYDNTTNNQMELIAIYYALASIKNNINSLEIISDSQYSIGVLTNPNWNPKKNKELISRIKKQLLKTSNLVKEPIKWTHVRGHKDNKYNNLADSLATNASL